MFNPNFLRYLVLLFSYFFLICNFLCAASFCNSITSIYVIFLIHFFIQCFLDTFFSFRHSFNVTISLHETFRLILTTYFSKYKETECFHKFVRVCNVKMIQERCTFKCTFINVYSNFCNLRILA